MPWILLNFGLWFSPEHRMKKAFNILLTVSIFLYPVLVYFGLQHFDIRIIAALILVILAVRFWFSRSGDTKRVGNASQGIPQFRFVLIGGILLILGTLVTDSEYGIKLYPALVSFGMLVIFASSLFWPPPIIERFARLMDKNFPEEAVPYTRKVTIAWCVFFVLNGSVAVATTFYASQEVWAAYNGLISYILIGLMFAVEYLIRRVVMRKVEMKKTDVKQAVVKTNVGENS